MRRNGGQGETTRRGLLGLGMALGMSAALAACSGGGQGIGAQQPSAPAQSAPTGSFGSGPVQVALLLPFSAGGSGGSTAAVLRNVSEMAVSEVPNSAVTVTPYDTKGTPQGARDAALEAIQNGARLILGPLFSNEVVAAGQVAGSTNVPVIAFSSDPNAAGGTVRLLSFLAESDVNRVVHYAAQNGRKSFGALVPENAYGILVENALRQAVSRNGGQLIAVERYKSDPAAIKAAAQKFAPIAAGANARVNAILAPEGAAAMPHIVTGLSEGGVDLNRVKMLGTGQWDDPTVLNIQPLKGGWFVAPDPAGFNSLQARYRSRYGGDLPRIATLAYDATSLAAALASIDQNNPYPANRLDNTDGFQGTDGIFRFNSSGHSQRGLAVLEVQPPGKRVVQTAPNSFRGQGF
ncbi:penicillin-binding protein activator [Tepidamorphus sp. 3E244]|uniref:penicillin-binding protein activator n=1 Tax=Tepidamorphus sp. 3E244 TaxID=3385498 RepID=UPI0038FC05FB